MKGLPKAVWLILALAFVLRLGAGDVLSDRLPVGADERGYLTMADSIAAGDGFPPRPFDPDGGASALTSPGYQYVLGGVRAALGDGEAVLRVLQALLGTVTVALLGLIAWQIFRERRVALAAMVIATVYPPLVAISGPVMTESLLLPLMLGAIAATLRWRDGGSLGWAALAGALAGAAALTKSIGVIAAAVIIVALWRPPRRDRSAFAAPALALACVIAVMAPWTIRNAVEFDAFVPGSNELGFGLAGAYNETSRSDSDHEWLPPGQLPEYRGVITDPDRTEVEVSRELTRRSLEFMTDHPGYVPALAFHNLARMLQIRPGGATAIDAQLFGFGNGAEATATFKAVYWLSALGLLALLVLAAISIARGDARRVPAFLAILAALVVLPLLFIAGGPRFRLPADVILIVYAAPAAAHLAYGLFSSMKSRRLST